MAEAGQQMVPAQLQGPGEEQPQAQERVSATLSTQQQQQQQQQQLAQQQDGTQQSPQHSTAADSTAQQMQGCLPPLQLVLGGGPTSGAVRMTADQLMMLEDALSSPVPFRPRSFITNDATIAPASKKLKTLSVDTLCKGTVGVSSQNS